MGTNDKTWTWEGGGKARTLDRSRLSGLRKEGDVEKTFARLATIIQRAFQAAGELGGVLSDDRSLSLERASEILKKALGGMQDDGWRGCAEYGVKCILMELLDSPPLTSWQPSDKQSWLGYIDGSVSTLAGWCGYEAGDIVSAVHKQYSEQLGSNAKVAKARVSSAICNFAKWLKLPKPQAV